MRCCSIGLVLTALFLLGPGTASGNAEKIIDDGVVITGVTVISPHRAVPLSNATVAIRDGRIASIGNDVIAGPQVKQIDGHGRFLIPGLIDSHVHVGNMAPLDDDAIKAHPDLFQAYRSQLPRAYLAFGFTTLIDLDLRPETLSWFNASPLHPNLCSCGRGIRIVGGYMALKPPQDAEAANAANIVYEPKQKKNWPANLHPQAYTPSRAVERAADAGAICVKTFVEPGFGGVAHWPVPSAQTLTALRTETIRRHLTFVVHANAVESWRMGLDARADVIAHGLWQWPGDRLNTTPPSEARKVISAAGAAQVWVQPTLQAVYGDLAIFDQSLLNDPRFEQALGSSLLVYLKGAEGQKAQRALADEYREAISRLLGQSIDPEKAMSVGPERAMATLRMMVANKVKLLFGTDTGSNQGIGNPPGLNGRMELDHWAKAGVPLSQIFRAATMDNARAFGLSDRGTIEVGKRADLLLLRANPLETIDAYDTIETIFLDGNPLPRATLLPAK